MDVDPDTMAAVSVEAWVMGRAATLMARNKAISPEQAVEQALVDLRRKYPAFGGALRGLNAQSILS
jgi:hypothetical protein